MKCNERSSKMSSGFTIVELLTVMGVIAVLISLLVPALNLVRDYSKEVQQKAQFHSMDVGVELFKTEFGRYPESNDNFMVPVHLFDPMPYSGANKFAEAMVGLDMLGFHPKSDFRSDGISYHDDGTGTGSTQDFAVYHPTFDYDAGGGLEQYDETAEENIQAREGPFIDLENANVFEMQDVYDPAIVNSIFRSTSVAPSLIEQSLVLCDVYEVKRLSGKKTGMPILYYKARTQFTEQFADDGGFGIFDDIYNYEDNENILLLGLPEDSTLGHPLADGLAGINPGAGPSVNDPGDYQDFERIILNTQITAIRRPFRADSFILISAGKDGLYGTADDITNF